MYAFNPLFKLKTVDISDDTQVNAGANRTDNLTPPAGEIYQVVDMMIQAAAPAGDTAGTHQFEIRTMETNNAIYTKLFCRGNHSTTIRLGTYFVMVGDSSEIPSADREQLQVMQGMLWANNDNPIKVYYQNDTDANQTGTRTMKFLVKAYKERQ